MTALSFVSATVNSSGNSATNIASAATASANLAAGNHVFVYVRWENSTTNITVTDTAGNTYTPLTKTVHASSPFVGGQWFYCLSATGNSANVVTASFSTSVAWVTVRSIIVAGTAPTSLVVTAATGSSSATLTMPSALTVAPGGMVLVGEGVAGSDSSWAFASGSVNWTIAGSTTGNTAGLYLASASGLYQSPAPTYTGTSTAIRVVEMLVIGDGSAPVVNSGISKLVGYTIVGGKPDGASVSRMTSYAVLRLPDPNAARPQIFVCT